ncbi:MAG: hypothetical protein KAS49_02025, partial [Candidatus Cloacimonetes bacterium]|nr:hypothetical protein [Candidatus Cloacimonadota bacterium]
RKLESLEEQISEASKLFDEKKDAALKQMIEQLQKEMSENELSQDLQQAIGNLQEKKMQQAMENQQSAMQKMQNLNQKLSEMSTFMSSMNMSANMESLNIAIKRLLIFSEDHEELSKRYNYDPYLIIADLIANYEGINKTVQELYSTPMILLILGPKFIYDTNGASRSFQELFSHINNAQNSKVEEFLHDIQKGLNLMIYDLILAKDNMQNSGGGGGGMESLMQSLQQMGQQQQMMNMLSLEMMQQMGQNGRISQEMYQQLGKMAADEQRLADNLKRAIQNNPDAQKQVSSLNKMIEDLENISRNLKRGRITQDIIDTQERILSRLLDAQKSIHKREFSKKRKAESSEVDDWDTPEEIKMKFEKMRRKALLEEDYQQYSKEHQALIKEYLKKLNED